MRGYRVGVVNPFGAFGKHVRELLDERDFPMIELKLFENRSGGGSTLTQFQDEIVITQPLDPDLFSHLDVIFFGGDERTELAREVAAAVGNGVLAIIHAVPDVEGRVMAVGLNDKPPPDPGAVVVAPRPSSMLLGNILSALGSSVEIHQALATVLLPASDKGKEAVRELHDQIVKILNFQAPPTEIFEEQLAFNLILPPSDGMVHPLDERIARESARLAGIKTSVSVMLVQAPIFHSYALCLWVDLSEGVEPEAVEKTLFASRNIKSPGGSSRRRPGVPSAVSVAESDKIHVGVRRDGVTPGGFWIWAVADSLALDPAFHAVQLAEKAFGVSKGRRR